MKLEVCVDTVDAATIAANAGADRIEVCAALSEGGLTPSYGVMKQVRKLSVSSHVMIRPRAGGFNYSPVEIDTMQQDIALVKKLGLDGVVFGVLDASGGLNIAALKILAEAAYPLETTLHRAIDMVSDPLLALDQAIDLEIHRILTSGQNETAFDGKVNIANMVHHAAGRISVMAGSGINTKNVAQIVRETSVRDVHSSCTSFRMPKDHFGFSAPLPERITDFDTVRAMKERLLTLGPHAVA